VDGDGLVTLRWGHEGGGESECAGDGAAPWAAGGAGPRALRRLPQRPGASQTHERFAAEALMLCAPRRLGVDGPGAGAPGGGRHGGGSSGGGGIEVSLHSLGNGALRRRAAEVFPGAPRGGALLAAVTFQFPAARRGGDIIAGGGDVSAGGGSQWDELEMGRMLGVFLAWAGAVRARLAARCAPRFALRLVTQAAARAHVVATVRGVLPFCSERANRVPSPADSAVLPPHASQLISTLTSAPPAPSAPKIPHT
jgi:hypothetical protein